MGKRTSARYTPDDACAAWRREVFEESGCTHIALGLGCGVAACAGVFACRTLGVGGAGFVPRGNARCSVFEESGCASLALRLGNGSYIDVLARRACEVLGGGAGIGLGAAARRNRFEESIGTTLTHRLSGNRTGYDGVLARRALAVRSATTIGTACIYYVESRMMVVTRTIFD